VSTEGKKFKRKQFAFSGEWNPTDDPLAIGDENYTVLENLRYRKRSGLEAVEGYTKITTNPLTVQIIYCGDGTYCGETYCGAPKLPLAPGAYYKGRSGIQLRNLHTTKSRVLVQAENVGETGSAVLENLTAIPNQGNFESDILHEDESGAGLGRFAKWPGGHVAYCNGKESKIFAGDEKECDAFITSTAAILHEITNAVDYTDAVKNILQTAGHIAIIDATSKHWLIGSTRRLQGVKFYIKTPNTTPSVLFAKEWAGNSWDLLTIVDSTRTPGVSLAQTGTVTWPHTENTSKVKLFNGQLLYWYQFELSAGSAEIYHVTVDTGWQAIGDLWDGLYRVVGMFRFELSSFVYDATMDVNVETPAGADAAGSYTAKVGGLTSSEWIDIGLEGRTCALYIKMFEGESGYVNANAAVMTLQYWTGAVWQTVSGFFDGTSDGGKTLAKSGFIVWDPPDLDDEAVKNAYDSQLYYYRITVSATLSANVYIDLVQGIPTPQTLLPGYKFPFCFRGRPMLCCNLDTKEGNRVDFGIPESTEGFNGPDSSFGNEPLYFGGIEDLTCSCELYNRFGANIYHMGIFCKDTETYLLTGLDADDYEIRKISGAVGCPAPLTMDTMEMGYAMAEGVVRMVAGFMSYNGVYLFDAGVLEPITGNIACYFDKSDPRCINFSSIERCIGWMDPDKLEYNLGLCSGAGQTEINVWVVFNMVLKRWFLKVPVGSDAYPQAAFRVVDINGAQYVYGLRDSGYMMRLENGPTWDGEDIVQKVAFADQVPTESMWDITKIRHFKLLCESIAEDVSISVKHYADGEAATATLRSIAAKGSNRYVRDTQKFDKRGFSHQFELEVSTQSTEKGVPLLAYGYTYERLSEDY